jgi:epoxyqueuosine reductase
VNNNQAKPTNLSSDDVKQIAHRLGFDACGISKAERLDEQARLLETWLARGFHGTMTWMERNFEKRVDPTELVPGAKSVISLVLNYYQDVDGSDDPTIARFSRYAWGDDYHEVAKERMFEMFDELDQATGGLNGRVFVDSAPIMDKVWAQRSGLGWIGKHTNLLNTEIGSWFFLGEIVVDLELQPDGPVPDHCGSCTRCLDACPTDAIVEPYVVDSNRCISYLTIEHRKDNIPDNLKPDFGNWVFGCDICQDVCPWNKFSRPASNDRFSPRPGITDTPISDWLELDVEAFRERFRRSAVRRTRYEGLMRNLTIAETNAESDD